MQSCIKATFPRDQSTLKTRIMRIAPHPVAVGARGTKQGTAFVLINSGSSRRVVHEATKLPCQSNAATRAARPAGRERGGERPSALAGLIRTSATVLHLRLYHFASLCFHSAFRRPLTCRST